MKLTWVNHASYILEYDNVTLITDPWYEGTAFDNGWALLAKSVIQPNDFLKVTHIWFSHEHPDHFSPPNLNKIPAEHRKNITVLFQNTSDRKIAEYCKKIGFGNVIEMESNTFYSLSPKIECMCNPHFGGDSWLYLKTDKVKLLNLNDCVIRHEHDARKIKNSVGDVDVLFTQFGYANKIGNTDETNRRLAASKEKLERIRIQCEVLKPSIIVPFASYIYFCHEENSYMNDGINRIQDVHRFIENEIKVRSVVLYPGDTWMIPDHHDSQSAIDRYMEDYKRLDTGELVLQKKKETISIAELQSESLSFKKKILGQQWKNRIFTLYPPAYFWLTDYAKAFKFDLKSGLTESDFAEEQCNISLSSETLLFSFKFLYGGDTLSINARFQTNRKTHKKSVRNYFLVASFVNRNENPVTKEFIKRVMEYTYPVRGYRRLQSLFGK
ncbi:MAG: MBL fold metallo-hydrolase [Flavobacteriales bacterium]